MAKTDLDLGSEYLVHFLDRFSGLMELQLNKVRSTMETTVDTVMDGVKNISDATEQQRISAELALEKTYLNPDAETQVLVEGLQKMIDDLFIEVKTKHENGEDLSQLATAEPEVLLQNRLQRFSGRFKQDMEKVGDLDSSLQNLVMGIIGSLSSEDVIAQKLDHIIMAFKVLQTGLNYVLIDYHNRCNTSELEKVAKDICNYTYRQYTTEEEKQELIDFFPELKSA